MSRPGDSAAAAVGVYLDPYGQGRVDFQSACGELFGRLFVADGIEQAAGLLAGQQVDLLIIDLQHFVRGIELPALGRLLTLRKGAPVLLVCPFTHAGWLAELLAFGPADYLIGPLQPAERKQRVAERLAARDLARGPTPTETELRALLALRTRVQQALAEADDVKQLGMRLCGALGGMPGVLHAALFVQEPGGLRIAAQQSARGIDLADILQQAPLRHAFPALLAASSGEMVWLDAPEKADPALAAVLRRLGVEMVLGLPVAADGPGSARGSVCLMFERSRLLSQDELATLADLARLAGFALRMADISAEGEQLLARLTQLATTDALTGVANRRRGEELLEQEIRRARRYQLPLALIALDIDHFRSINQRYGHPVGDLTLRTVAGAIGSALRSSDILTRSGGEEFQIVAPHTSAIDALKIAEKIRLTIAATAIPGCDRVTISLGVAQLGEQESGDALAQRVNAALARAKRAGRNCVELAMR